ncbi:MAG: ABC-type transport system substrate-binding protein, partial [Glaciecola sp.]
MVMQKTVARAVLALLLASCANPMQGPKSVDAPAPRRTPVASAGAVAGGELRVSITEPSTLDPVQASTFDPSGYLIARTMCDTLVEQDPVTGELRPGILKSWDIQLTNGGAAIITMKVRRGVYFHDGTEVTASDVSYTLARLANLDIDAPMHSLVEPIMGYSLIRGLAEPEQVAAAPAIYLSERLQGVEVLQRDVLQVTTVTSQEPGRGIADLLLALSQPAAAPVPRRLASGDAAAFAAHPVCAGPYELEGEWSPGDERIVLQRAQAHVPGPSVYSSEGLGYADRIEFHVIEDRAAQLAAYTAGAIDVASVLPIQLDDAARAQGRIVLVPLPQMEYVAFPTDDPRFASVATRQALSQGLDRTALAAAAYGGASLPAVAMMPTSLLGDVKQRPCKAAPPTPRLESLGSFARIPAIAPPGTGSVSLEDPARDAADAAVAQDDAPRVINGLITLSYNDEHGHRELMESVAAQWRANLGLDVEVVPLTWLDYEDRLLRRFGLSGQREVFDGAFRASWAAHYPSRDAWLSQLLGSEGTLASVGANVSNSVDDEFER